jgi:hypothetical protein
MDWTLFTEEKMVVQRDEASFEVQIELASELDYCLSLPITADRLSQVCLHDDTWVEPA